MRNNAPYHVRVKIIGRTASSVVSAPEAAAYRSGTAIRGSVAKAAAYRAAERISMPDAQGNEVVHDYTRKSDVLDKGIVLPEGETSTWATDRARLWNTIETIEKRKDAQLAREVEVMLPRELSFDQQKSLLLRYIKAEFTSKSMVADYAIHCHKATDGGDHPHAHILLPLRSFADGQFSATKPREWNSKEMLLRWRQQWAMHVNSALEQAGYDTRIDHRSLKAQGIDREPQHSRGKVAQALHKADKPHTPSATLAKERYAQMRTQQLRHTQQKHHTARHRAYIQHYTGRTGWAISSAPRSHDYSTHQALYDLMQQWMFHTVVHGVGDLLQEVLPHASALQPTLHQIATHAAKAFENLGYVEPYDEKEL